MSAYSTDELKVAWKRLFNVECFVIWRDVNTELTQRLGEEEYNSFVKAAHNDFKMSLIRGSK